MINTYISVQREWNAGRSFNNSFTITFTINGSAFDISTYTFSLAIRRIGGETDVLSLTQGSGITNGGASGVLTIQITDTQTETIDANSYFYSINYVVGLLPYSVFHGTFNLLKDYNPNTIDNSVTVPVNLAGTNVNADVSLGVTSFNTRSVSTASTATLTPNVDLYDFFVISAQAEALLIANPTGTAVLGNGFMVDIEDNGTARAITYGNLYTSTFVTLPTTTILGKRMKLVFQYNGTNWELLNVINEQ